MLVFQKLKIKESIPFSGAKSLVMKLCRFRKVKKRVRILTGLSDRGFYNAFLPWTQNIPIQRIMYCIKARSRDHRRFTLSLPGRIRKMVMCEKVPLFKKRYNFTNLGDQGWILWLHAHYLGNPTSGKCNCCSADSYREKVGQLLKPKS